VFAALADPHRRRLIERLRSGPQPVHALAQDAEISRSAVSQHLAVLRQAGLVRSERRGRQVLYTSVAGGVVSASEWVTRFRDVQLRRSAADAKAMQLHISAAAIPVVDQDRARDFYASTLDFELVTDRTVNDWRWISLLPPGGTCAVALVQAPIAGVWTGLSLLTADLEQIYHRWTARKVWFAGPPVLQPWGARTTLFADIDGNHLQLVERPAEG
jgi:DNA-binding transcriptional ArsR family regulator/catechol 2,3-dioxygenase-like lactoylglutathione lyase family enzyme